MKCYLIVITLFACVCTSTTTVLQNGNVTLVFNIVLNDGLLINLIERNTTKLSGHIGAGIRIQATKNPRRFKSSNNEVEFSIVDAVEGFNILWQTSNTSITLRDCYDLLDFDWFAGRVGNTAEWPIQKSEIKSDANIVSNSSPVAEPYWLNSKGGFLVVNETTPLFVDQNNLLPNNLCLLAKIEKPYLGRSRVVLNYTIAANENATAAHKNAVLNHLGRPTGQPDTKMIREPVWSTWIKYKDDINDELVLDLAQSIQVNGFRGQVQIDDGWEECYGSLTFKKLKFAAINTTIISIKNLALRVTLWVHPFVATDCLDYAQIGLKNGYFVKGTDGKEIKTSWKNEESVYLIDFTNQEARDWFVERVELLIEKHQLDGFSFDAGEASWASPEVELTGDHEREPNDLTSNYNSISNFTTFVHVTSGWRTQWVPVFINIPDKEQNWSLENGLKSVLINLFQLNLAGYTMVFPGLIGGKSIELQNPELFVRWIQAVTFMPVLQFGRLPWEIIVTNFDVYQIVKKFVDLHYWYADGITNIIKKSKSMGLPVNPPIWWVDPTNPEAFKITDQYMLGENIMIAPILNEGAVSRDIYLPPGQWRDGNNSTIYEGGTTLKNYPAPIDVLPYFERVKD